MANKNSNGDWIDPRGRAVPRNYVKPIDRKRDRVVEKICNDALKLEERMRKLKKDMLNRISAYLADLEAELQAPRTGKGNMTLTNFSGNRQVEIGLNDIITFNESLSVAKGIIDDCLHRWAEGAHKNLKAIVDQAFNVDKGGKVNTQAILKLRQLNIKDKEWKRAMEIIANSIQIEGTRQYLLIRTRETPHDKFETVNLNFSSINVK